MKNTEFGAIYARYRARSKRLARAILKNEDEAEDVCHDVFVKLYKMGEEFDTSSEKKMESWILTTTERTALDYYKKGYRKHEYADSDEIERAAEVLAQSRSTVDEVIEVIEAHDSVGAIFRELRRRNERNYEIYVRVKLCHMPPETVARQFHTTSNNVNNIVMRTKRCLMKEYDRNSDL